MYHIKSNYVSLTVYGICVRNNNYTLACMSPKLFSLILSSISSSSFQDFKLFIMIILFILCLSTVKIIKNICLLNVLQ